MRHFIRRILPLLAVVVWFAGCGYHVAGKGGRMPGNITTLSIPVFKNATGKPDIESIMTSAFVSEMVNAVEVKDGGEAVMTGVIKSYDLRAVSFTRSDVNLEYRLTVAISLEIRKGENILWKDENVVDYEDFTVNTSDVAATRDAERAALKKLSKDTARNVKERMLSNF